MYKIKQLTIHSTIAILFILLLLNCFSCTQNHSGDNVKKNIVQKRSHPLPDTLNVGTLYSPTSYFIYKEEAMGYEYDMVQNFAKDKGIIVKLKVVGNINKLVELLDSGYIDLAAYEIPITSEYKNSVIHCGVQNITNQVLVQPKSNHNKRVNDVIDLVGKTVYVEKDSKYEQRIRNLNNELGGGLNIKTISKDTLIEEDMIEMVSNGKIPMTIIDSDVAKFNSTYYNDLDISLPISLEQKSSWAVNLKSKWLADSIDAWAKGKKANDDVKHLQRRYFEMSKTIELYGKFGGKMLKKGKISHYDELFQIYGRKIKWDWRLLAAQAYNESGFNNKVVSWAGARGIMQIMPRTAANYGLSINDIENPEKNIATSVKIIASLEKMFKYKVVDSKERLKFILASYNSGPAHILDAIALAEKYGRNAQKWDGHVRDMLIMKSRPEYYNDPVVKYGYFRATQTVEYVDKVINTFNIYCKSTKK